MIPGVVWWCGSFLTDNNTTPGKDRYHVIMLMNLLGFNEESESNNNINININININNNLAGCDMIGAAGQHAAELWSDRKCSALWYLLNKSINPRGIWHPTLSLQPQ